MTMKPAYGRGGSAGTKLPKPKGKYSPVIDMGGAGHNVLYRTLKVPADAKTLKLKAFWHNAARAWHFAGSFQNQSDGDQYFSIDLLKPNADPESTKHKDVYKNVFSPDTTPYTPPPPLRHGAARRATRYVSGWKSLKAKVKRYRGQKVMLRLAESDTLLFNYVGIDDVKFK